MKSIIFFVIAGATFLFQSCRQQPEIPVKISRLEQSLFNIPIESIAESIPHLKKQYGELFDLYCLRVISIGTPDESGFSDELTKFLTDSYMYNSFKRVMEVYPDLKELETGLGRAFYNYRMEFPERVIPSVYTLTSGFNQSMITSDSILAIALDKYLGNTEDMYFRLEIANYQRQTMDRKYLLPDCMKAWIYTEFPYNDSIDNVLTNILYEGKIMYAVQKLLPATPDSLIFGFTSAQMRWCRNNTEQMWIHLIDNKMLFSTNHLTINKLVGPAPFSSLFTRESPGRAAVWVGYQIIASYMKRNNVTLEALLEDNDYGKILAKARFKP